jgi:hypothetical protein
MKTATDVENLEKTIGQLKAIHLEVSLLSRKSQNDALNKFKLNMINKVLSAANHVLGERYRPFDDFDEFDSDDAPSNSDVAFVVAQYIEEIERFRTAHVEYHNYKWVYMLNGKPSSILADPKDRAK